MLNRLIPLCVIVFIINSINVNSQVIITKNDTTFDAKLPIILKLKDYKGNIQWEKSFEEINWTEIPGATLDTLVITAKENAYYRASVKLKDCASFYTDTTAVFANIDSLGDGLSEEDNLLIESISRPTPPLDSFLTYSGVPFSKLKSTNSEKIIGSLIDSLIRKGNGLCLLKKNKNYNEAEPFHMGLAYSSGQKNYKKRENPPDPIATTLHRKDAVYGLDCSGLIVNLFKESDVNITDKSAVINGSLIKNLKLALKEYKNMGVKLTNMSFQTIDKVKRGDLIVWNGHIGLLGEIIDGTFYVIQSNGDPYPDKEEQQIKNRSDRRGVHTFILDSMISKTLKENGKLKYWGTKYNIYRLEYEPYSIEIINSCNNQVGQLGKPLTNPISVLVKDLDGNPYSGAMVEFKANNGGSVSQNTVKTGPDGIASVIWTLGSTDDNQSVTVSAKKSDNFTIVQGSPITFFASTKFNYWGGMMYMTSQVMLEDCIGECGTGGCQSCSRALFGSSWGTSSNIEFTYTAIQPTNNFRMIFTIGGNITSTAYTCYTANILKGENFKVYINFYAPGGSTPPNDLYDSYLQEVNFIIINQTANSISGTWSGNIRSYNKSCLETCSGTWNVSGKNTMGTNCQFIPSNP